MNASRDRSSRSAGWREAAARILWHAHPARPGPLYAELRQSQWWPRERLEAAQAEALRRLVRIASRVPHYGASFAAAGLSPDSVRSLADLGRFPILERDDLRRLGIAGLRVPGSRGVRASTSGSTGQRVSFLWPLEQMRWLDAGEARARAWLGSDVGTRRLEVRCRPVGWPQELSAVLLNTAAFHAPVVAEPAAVRRLVEALAKNPPALVWGVSNALYVLATALLDGGRSIAAGACWSGGNHLHPHYRRAFERAFACEVYERYATMETGLIAHECVEGRSLHVPAEGIVVEVVRPDGSPAAPGETGDVLVTTLHNTATPLLRYRVGDRAVAPDGSPCVCGRGLPKFGRVTGRIGDVLRTAGGELLDPPQVARAAAIGDDSVVDFQVIQSADLGLRLRVVQRAAPTVEADRQRLATLLEDLVGPPRPIVVERLPSLPLTPGGKVRTVIAEP